MDIRAARTWRNRRTATLRDVGDVGHIQALTTAHSGLRVVLEDGLGEVRPCRTSQQQGRRNVLTPGGELGRAMPWYRSGVLCNSQTSRRPVGDDGDVPHHPQVLEGVGGIQLWESAVKAVESVSECDS